MPAIADHILEMSESIDPASYVIATYLAQGPVEEDMLSRAIAVAVEQTVGRGIFNMESMGHVVKEHGGRLIGFLPVPDHESKSSQVGLEWKRYVFRVAFTYGGRVTKSLALLRELVFLELITVAAA